MRWYRHFCLQNRPVGSKSFEMADKIEMSPLKVHPNCSGAGRQQLAGMTASSELVGAHPWGRRAQAQLRRGPFLEGGLRPRRVGP